MSMIRIAIVGVGNCASALVQGIEYYRSSNTTAGLIIPDVFGWKAGDIEVVAAFDVDAEKIGKTLNQAIFEGQNNTLRFAKVGLSNCIVAPAPRLDGVGREYEKIMRVHEGTGIEVRNALLAAKPDVLVNYLPVGSDKGTAFWAELCLEQKIGFVNAIPSFIVSNGVWRDRFMQANVPCAGDDVKSQIGATIVHRALANTFAARGGQISDTYQLNFGGNMDFRNMLEEERLNSKRHSKVNSVLAELSDMNLSSEYIHISPTDHIRYLKDNKIAYINIRGSGFGGAPIEVETKISVWDSPNSAAVVVDVIRFVAGARREGIGGALPICDFYFKSPPEQAHDQVAESKARHIAKQATFRKATQPS